jgi:hypothetical protein
LGLGKNPNFLVETLKKNLQKIWVFTQTQIFLGFLGMGFGYKPKKFGFLGMGFGFYPNFLVTFNPQFCVCYKKMFLMIY